MEIKVSLGATAAARPQRRTAHSPLPRCICETGTICQCMPIYNIIFRASHVWATAGAGVVSCDTCRSMYPCRSSFVCHSLYLLMLGAVGLDTTSRSSRWCNAGTARLCSRRGGGRCRRRCRRLWSRRRRGMPGCRRRCWHRARRRLIRRCASRRHCRHFAGGHLNNHRSLFSCKCIGQRPRSAG